MSKQIQTTCPQCQARLAVSAEKAGSVLRCPNCRTSVETPAAAAMIPVPSTDVDEYPIQEHESRSNFEFPNVPLMPRGKRVPKHGPIGYQQVISALGSKKRAIALMLSLIAVVTFIAGKIASEMRPPASTRDPAPKHIEQAQRLPNKIRSMEVERHEDPAFVEALTPINVHLITRIRTLAVASNLQFEESYLGDCDDRLTTVVFSRPEASYDVAALTIQDKDFSGYVYPDQSSMTLDSADYFERVPDRDYLEIADISSAKQALRHGGLAAALVMEPDLAKQGDLKSAVSALLNSPEVDRLLEAAIKGQDVDMVYACGPLTCQILGRGYVDIRFRRPR